MSFFQRGLTPTETTRRPSPGVFKQPAERVFPTLHHCKYDVFYPLHSVFEQPMERVNSPPVVQWGVGVRPLLQFAVKFVSIRVHRRFRSSSQLQFAFPLLACGEGCPKGGVGSGIPLFYPRSSVFIRGLCCLQFAVLNLCNLRNLWIRLLRFAVFII